MATVETRTLSPMTITPATSSITTLAGASGSTPQVLDLGDEADHVPAGGRPMVTMVGFVGAAPCRDSGVDRVGDAAGGGEVGIAQGHAQLGHAGQLEADLALDDGAAGDPAGGRHALGDAMPEAPRAVTEPVCTVPWATA